MLTSLLFSRALVGQDVLSQAREAAAARRFDEAVALYDRVLAREPGRWDAEIGRAEALVWGGRYALAEETYRRLGRRDPASVLVARGLARAAYWSGDFRRALPRFERVARLAPGDREAREAIDALRELMRPTANVRVAGRRDNQPAATVALDASSTLALDPLTFLDAELGGLRLDAEDAGGVRGVARARIGLSARLPRPRLRVAASVGGLRVGERMRALADVSAEHRRGPWSVSAGAVRGVALDSAPAFLSAVSLEQLFAGVKREEGTITGAAEVRGTWYGDGNAGLSSFAWAEGALLTHPSFRLAAGVALAYADTRDARTEPLFVGSTPSPSGGFRYEIRTLFAPYVTPERQLEGRLSVHATFRPEPRLRLDLSGEWGEGRERATGYGPEAGPTPRPATMAGGTFSRTYEPWKALLAAEWVQVSWRCRLELRRQSTAFYTTSALGLTLTRRL